MSDLPILRTAQPRILVFRALQVGDLLCAVPALRALRAAQPAAEITLVSLPWAEDFVRRFDRYIDHFVAFPGHPALPERDADIHWFPAFLHAIQARHYDLAIQLHGSGEVTNPLLALFGARCTAGFIRPGAWRPDPLTFHPYPETGHEVERLLGLVEALGAPRMGTHLEFPIADAERAAARRLLADNGGGPYAIVHPGSRSGDRRWPTAAFAHLANVLSGEGVRVVVTGSSVERPLADAVCAAADGLPRNVSGETTLGTLAALVEAASLVVTNDTGVSHIAAALGIPSVVLFSGSDPARWAPLDARRHRAVLPGTPLDQAVEVAREQLALAAVHA